jgi:hypothetical protein
MVNYIFFILESDLPSLLPNYSQEDLLEAVNSITRQDNNINEADLKAVLLYSDLFELFGWNVHSFIVNLSRQLGFWDWPLNSEYRTLYNSS